MLHSLPNTGDGIVIKKIILEVLRLVVKAILVALLTLLREFIDDVLSPANAA